MRRLLLFLLLAAGASAAITASLTVGDNTVTVRHVPRKVAPAPPGDLNLKVPLNNGGTNESTLEGNNVNEGRLLPKRPAAGAQTVSCPSLYDGHLYSSRGGVRATEWVLHYTAGNGTAESIDAYFRRTRAASATYLLEPSGHCRQEVPESEKPWTQLAANPYAISVEIVTTGWNVSRAGWLAMPIFSHGYLAALMKDSMLRNGIPIRRVDPVGCNFIPGYTDHNALECGNDHTDVLPNFPWDVLAKQLADGGVPATSDHAKKLCGELKRIRRYVARHGGDWHSDEKRLARAEAIKAALAKPRRYSGFPGRWLYECHRGSGCQHVKAS